MNHVFLSDFIFWTEVHSHKKIKNELILEIKNNLNNTKNQQKNFWLCNVNTEFFSGNQEKYNKYINLIVGEIYPALDKLFNELDLKIPKTSTVTEIWYNYYKNHDGQEVHAHIGNGSTISGIYLLHLEEENKTVFYQGSHNTELTNAVKTTNEIKEGSIILFPSHLLHYVLPCSSERITVAFNIKCTF